jgi:hypothetical protein
MIAFQAFHSIGDPDYSDQPVGFTDFRLSGASDQNGLSVVAGVDPVLVPDALGLCLAVA